MHATGRVAWIDASSGVAGDMLLGALADAGASLEAMQSAVDAVIPSSVRLTRSRVTRAGMRAARVEVEALAEDHPHRTWRAIRDLLQQAVLPEKVREQALAVFGRLAEAEARAHRVPVEDVHFHEVGAWDSIADVVGVSAGLHDLGVTRVTAGPVAVGSGRVATAHGDIPVPVPAVLELAAGWEVFSGGTGELATPTGMALVTVLAEGPTAIPRMRVDATGTGAGTRDTPQRPNTVRVVLGAPAGDGAQPQAGDESSGAAREEESDVVLEANVDDLDPRVWPGVLAALLDAGASDAWLVPILMKKGRPAHTLRVLAAPGCADELRRVMFRETSTIGVRETPVRKTALDRTWVTVPVLGGNLPVKVAHSRGLVVQATPEFDDAAALAGRLGLPVRSVLEAAVAACAESGLVQGAPAPLVPGGHGGRDA